MNPHVLHPCQGTGDGYPTPRLGARSGLARRRAFLAQAALWVLVVAVTAMAQERARVAPQISVSADRARLSTVESLVLTVEVVAMPGQDVEITPPLITGEPLGDWTIAAIRRDAPVLDGGGVLHRWTVRLEPFLPGAVVVPPLSVRALSGDGESAGSVDASESIVIQVTSVMDEDAPFDPGVPPPPLDPLPDRVSPGSTGWPITIAALGGLAVGAAGVLAVRPTLARLVRRRFAALRREAAEISGDGGRAQGTVNAAHRAAAMLRRLGEAGAGSRGAAATSSEFASVVGLARAGVPPEEVARVAALLAWYERCVYSAVESAPPPLPDLRTIVHAVEGEAARGAAMSGARHARPRRSRAGGAA